MQTSRCLGTVACKVTKNYWRELFTACVPLFTIGLVTVLEAQEVRNVELLELGGVYVNDVSDDGSIIIGVVGWDLPFSYKNGEGTNLLANYPGQSAWVYGISSDGSVIVGMNEASHACRFENGMIVEIGGLSGGSGESLATAVSADGSVVVGKGSIGNGLDQAFRWEDEVMVGLGGGYLGQSRATDVSADGSVIAGFIILEDGSPQAAFYDYSDSSSGWILLENPEGIQEPAIGSKAHAISGNGKVVVGAIQIDEFISIPVMWTLSGDMQVTSSILAFPDDCNSAIPTGVSNDGSIVVGAPDLAIWDENYPFFVYWPLGDNNVIIYWSEDENFVPSVILNSEISEESGFNHFLGPSISGDGSTIVGTFSSGHYDVTGYRLALDDTYKWGPYEVVDDFCNTASFLGWIWIKNAPWVWSSEFNCWLNIPEETAEASKGWVYIADPDELLIAEIDGTNWGFSYNLNKWLCLTDNGWAYMPIVSDLIAIPNVSAGLEHSVGLKYNGTVVAIGDNEFGQCNVNSWTDIVQISAGNDFTVGLKADGTVLAVGKNTRGQCNVDWWNNVVQVAAGWNHTLGLKSDGRVFAVGNNDYEKSNVSGWWGGMVQIAAGRNHSIALRENGTVVAIGDNSYGQCSVYLWSDIVQIAVGGDHTLGLKSDGTVVAAGNNANGQCNVESWTDIVQIAGGRYHSLGLKSDGSVVAAGSNPIGQCDVEEWTDIMFISTMATHSIGVKSNGQVLATGRNSEGQCNFEGIILSPQ